MQATLEYGFSVYRIGYFGFISREPLQSKALNASAPPPTTSMKRSAQYALIRKTRVFVKLVLIVNISLSYKPKALYYNFANS